MTACLTWLHRLVPSSLARRCLVISSVILLVFNTVPVSADEKCTTCKDIVKNVMKGVEKTAKSNFGGGNTKWEENSLGSYTFSETRLVEILEHACEDSTKRCHSMLEEHEETMEMWWFKLYAKGKETDLHKYLCINELNVCCPNGTFGPDCKECAGGKDRPCKGTGKCQGDGTREGSGKCNCDAGYHGDLCDDCKDKYFEESKNDTHTVCKACDESCKSGCWEAGPQGCDDCVDGWEFAEDEGCQDIDECEPDTPCEEDEYCTNNPGSYKCSPCSKSCIGCTGPGANKCVECAELHYLDQTSCIACHRACESSCTDSSGKSCDQCKEGWRKDEVLGCVDVNECESGEADCAEDEYCSNAEGSFKCPNCHYACEGCTGPGANDCKQCKTGYRLQEDGYCSDVDECAVADTCPGENSRCVNTPGSYKCDCRSGYALKDGVCIEKPKDSPPKKINTSSSESSSEKKKKNESKKPAPNKDKSSKKSKKKSKNKSKKKDSQYQFWQYWMAIVLFAMGGVAMHDSIFAQLLFSCVIWLYLFWFGLKFDKTMTKS